jgi:hypothetical protein
VHWIEEPRHQREPGTLAHPVMIKDVVRHPAVRMVGLRPHISHSSAVHPPAAP